MQQQAHPASQSRIRAEVDFERDGKQVGYLRLPHSVNRSAYGFIPIPITVLRNGAGPSALIMAGSHGDEYEGQVAASNAIRWLEPEMIRGRVIVLPAANFPAAMAGARVSPIDEGNLNRLYPGEPLGTPTQQVAFYIEHVLLPMVDVVLDLHSGGSSLAYIPSISVRRSVKPELFDKGVAILKALGAPLVYVPRDSQGGDVSMSGAARRQGVLNFGTELGGGGHLNPAALGIAETAIRNLLVEMSILPDAMRAPAIGPTRVLEVGGPDYFVYAPSDGVLEPMAELGDEVSAGQPAARIHPMDTPWREPEVVRFARDGLVLCKRTLGRTIRGDCLFHLGTDTHL